MRSQPYFHGIYPILATCFNKDESIDYKSQEKLINYCIDQGAHGLVTLANASEGHLLSDDEKMELLAFVIEKVKKRIPVIVTVNHPSAYCAVNMSRYAASKGADAVMCMPPFFGRWRAGLSEVETYFGMLNSALEIPIILQDHQLSDISLPVDFLAKLSHNLDNLKYIKLESGNIIHKGRELLAHPDSGLDGVFGGNSGVFLPEEYQAGCCGTMPACYMPEIFRNTWDLLADDHYQEAVSYFSGFSRLTAYEKDVANHCLWKEILKAKGVIAHATIRGPKPAFFNDWFVNQLFAVAKGAGLKV
ncbi:dihydrodipicolinate synthase family protein [Gramella sp. AN32]|uniref:Dihydrodipicolinate synthase family protein n=1 Tax=Christiangramia antarctica TaxID=2058158 RepID=A0ABW5X3E8_9FLAO|nr:dihydrodipicolinate synthase family protein [Gramella sp. AN32]MCM4155761.1 hypothetical protein [Gramella sp. AN32]